MDLIKLLCFIELYGRVSSFIFKVYDFEIDISITSMNPPESFSKRSESKSEQKSVLPGNFLRKKFKKNN